MSSSRTPRKTGNFSAAPWQSQLPTRSAAPVGPPKADGQDMLELMRRHRGQMAGNIAFVDIRSESHEWHNAYCYIDAASASLLCEVPEDGVPFVALIEDLRGCSVRAVYEDMTRISIIELLYRSSNGEEGLLRLRPERPTYFNSWYAALLCWQVVRPGQRVLDDEQVMPPTLRPLISDERALAPRAGERNNAPLQTERAMLLVEGSPDFSNSDYPSNTTATNVNCVLRGTGELSIHDLSTKRTMATIQIRALPRCAIQRLHRSVFGLGRTMAIYPQYARSHDACSNLRPLYLSFNYTDSYERLLVHLKAFALPEIHSVSTSAVTDTAPQQHETQRARPSQSSRRIFRVEQFMSTRIDRAKLRAFSPHSSKSGEVSNEFYVEMLVDEQVKAKTSVRASATSDFYWMESFDLVDLPSVISSISFQLKKRAGQQPADVEMSDTVSIITSKTGMYVQSMHSAFDELYAVAEVELATLPFSKDNEVMLNLKDEYGADVGALALTLRWEEQLILTESEYDGLTMLLQDFSNSVTLDIFHRTPIHTSELSNILLNIFQANGTAEIWLRHLIRDEIYNPRRQRSRSSANNTQDPATRTPGGAEEVEDRTNEALLLFRGNTLLTRALDSYMRRVGQTYLEQTLRDNVRKIAASDRECEIDPTKLGPHSDHEENLHRLLQYTKEVWIWIRCLAFNCPLELRRIFRTIRDCATDRFGDIMPSKVYTSVSSFLFLRFFCAAIMGPRLFGLLSAEPKRNAQRTFLLIAKSLQGLANMTTFGTKEPWMAPMNTFCSAYRQQFETFIDAVCDVDLDPLGEIATSDSTTAPSASQGLGIEEPSEAQTLPGSAATQLGGRSKSLYSGRDSTSPVPSLSESAGAMPLPDSQGNVEADFDTAESLAYANSFATEAHTPDSRATSPDLDAETLIASGLDEQSRESIDISSREPRNTNSRMSMASQQTVIWVGDERTGSKSPSTIQRNRAMRASIASNRTVDSVLEDANNTDDDASSIYGPFLNRPPVDQSDAASISSDDTEAAMPPSIPRSRDRASGSSLQTATDESSRPSTAQTAVTRPSSSPYAQSLRGKPSTYTLNDPLRELFDGLHSHAREGFLSLPGLVDPPKNLALLVNIWLDSVEIRIHRAAAAAAAAVTGNDHEAQIAPILSELNDSSSQLARFHSLCLSLRETTMQYRAQAQASEAARRTKMAKENDGITADNVTVKWVTIAERIETSPHQFWMVRSDRRSSRSSRMSRDSRVSSVYTSASDSDSFGATAQSSRESFESFRSASTISSAAPPPPAISRDPRGQRERDKPTRPSTRISLGPTKRYPEDPPASSGKKGFGRFISGGNHSATQSSRASGMGKDGGSTPSLNSSGSDQTAHTARSTQTKDSKSSAKSSKSRKKSPPRTAEQNAMRKLGWM